MGPNWDQHGNAQVGVPKCVPCGPIGQNVVGPTWAPHMGPMWATSLSIETWDPLGSEVGSSWKIVHGSHLGCPSGTHFAAHLGIPVGGLRKKNSDSESFFSHE